MFAAITGGLCAREMMIAKMLSNYICGASYYRHPGLLWLLLQLFVAISRVV